MATDDAGRFDVADPLPRGKLAIQASAGTGKTYTLADLATRFIAEGRASASELLIVTFTRAATDELRSRVRDRLVGAVAHLASGHPAPDEMCIRDSLRHRALRPPRDGLDEPGGDRLTGPRGGPAHRLLHHLSLIHI